MKTRKATKEQAIAALNKAGINLSADFHSLPSSDVDKVVEWAIKCGYRKPANANGSRGRYFFQCLAKVNFKAALTRFDAGLKALAR